MDKLVFVENIKTFNKSTNSSIYHIEYIGRANSSRALVASCLNNPFRLTSADKNNEAARAACIARYRVWLTARLADKRSPQSLTMSRLVSTLHTHHIVLLCWCAPQACHGDVVREILMSRYAAYKKARSEYPIGRGRIELE